MPRIKTNPFLLMPDLSEIGNTTTKQLEDTGRDCLDTLDQIPDDIEMDDRSGREHLDDIVRAMRPWD